jgi:hypothetical protein
MLKKSILLVSSAFYPEISPRSFRATELAKEFFRQGHKVVVLSKYRDFDYTDFLKEYSLSFKMWPKPKFPRIPMFTKQPFSLISRVLSRLLGVFFEYPGIEEMFQVKKELQIESGYDLLISFAVPYPVHWGVAMARNVKHPIARIWIADCGDPFMFARLDRFKKPFYFKYPEVNFCSKCNYISIPFQAMENQFYTQFLPKMKIIPQGFSFDKIPLYNGPRNNPIPVFIFAGSLIPGRRDLRLFFDFLKTLKFEFLFIVFTNQKDLFRSYEAIFREKLLVKGYVDRLTLIYEMSKADFLVNVDSILDTEENIEAIPSKLIDYALANRPILNINSAFIDKESILKFLNRDYSGQRYIDIANYDIRKVSAKFLELTN